MSQIWNTLVKNNRSAMTYFWPGSVVEIGGLYASMQRVAQLTKFLQPLNLAIFTILSLFNLLAVPAPHLVSLFLAPNHLLLENYRLLI